MSRPANFTIVWILQIIVSALLVYNIFRAPAILPIASLSAQKPVSSKMAPIVHIVLFQFKSTAAPEAIKDACDRMLGLKTACLHPTSNTPYIKSAVGGKDNSPENLQGGLTHGFVVEFDNEEDRQYYVDTDPAHKAFVASLGSLVEKATVLDFTPGVY